MRTLIGIENLRRTVACQCFLERLNAELHVQRVRQVLSQNPAGRPVHDRHEIEEAAPHGECR